MNQSELSFAKVNQLHQQLQQEVFGQNAAITTLCHGLTNSLVVPAKNKPLANFLFIGPSATGKSFLAERLAARLGDEWQFITIPMSSMVVATQSAMLDGNEPSYTNARPGVLTDFVRQNPKTVVVFEDIDKAHPVIISRLSSIVNNGTLRDQFGFYKNNQPNGEPLAPADVSFSQSIVIFTSSALDQLYSSASFQLIEQQSTTKARATLQAALQSLESTVAQGKVFESGLINSLGSEAIVLFKTLLLPELIDIAQAGFHKLRRRFITDYQCQLNIADSDEFFRLMVLGLAPDIDARQVTGQLLANLTRQVTSHAVGTDLPSRVEWGLDDAVKLQFAELIAKAGNAELINWFLRKGLVLKLGNKTHLNEQTLQITYQQLAVEKVIHQADLQGLGSISIEVPAVNFADIVGHNLVKHRLQQTIKLLNNPTLINQHKVSLPRGLLLYGPPGTGKTMLAKAFANEADFPFISVIGTDLLDLNFVKALFARARKYAPAILFIDEIDVVGSREGRGINVIINQLLTEIDGFNTDLSPPVFVIAATNRPQDLDPALIRAGRIDIHIHVPTLDREARGFFIKRYFDLPNDGTLNEQILLNLTSGMSGAELEQIRREVLLEMIRLDLTQINQQMLLEFINQRKYGHRATVKRTLDDLTATAYHEAGHAVVSRILNPETLIEQISIASRGNMAGFVAFNRDPDHYKRITAREVLEEIAVLLAGRCAEVQKFGKDSICAGASSDLAK